MHELSLCQSLVEAAVGEFEKLDPRPRRLVKIRVVVGALRSVVPEFMQEAFGMLRKDTPADGAELEIVVTPVIGKCADCGWKGEMPRCSFVCGKCGSDRAELVGGRELYLDNLEVEV